MLAICERKGLAGVWHRTVSRAARGNRRSDRTAAHAAPRAAMRNTVTRNLPYGKQRLVEIALALATKPRILLLDEPAAGIPAGGERGALPVIAALPTRRHDPVHRARHGAGVPLRRAHHGAGRRQGADRGHAGRDRGGQARARKSISARRSMAELLALDDVTAGYGDSVVLEDVSLRAAGGRQPRAARPQRRRQDDAARDADGTHAPARRRACAGAAPTSRRCRRYRRAQAGLGWVPQERFMFPSLTVEEHLTAVARPGRWTVSRGVRALSAPRRNGAATSATSSRAASSRCSRSRAR